MTGVLIKGGSLDRERDVRNLKAQREMMYKTRRGAWTRSSLRALRGNQQLLSLTPFSLPKLVLMCYDLGTRAPHPNVCPVCYVTVPETLTEALTPPSQAARTLANVPQISEENEILIQHIFTYKNKTSRYREFPGGPVVRTLRFHC